MTLKAGTYNTARRDCALGITPIPCPALPYIIKGNADAYVLLKINFTTVGIITMRIRHQAIFPTTISKINPPSKCRSDKLFEEQRDAEQVLEAGF